MQQRQENFFKTIDNQNELDTALAKYISQDNTVYAALLLIQGANPNRFTTKSTKDTLLHEAIKKNLIQLVKVMLSYGAKLNLLNDIDENALHIAIRAGSIECIELLIAHGARVVYTDKDKEDMSRLTKQSHKPLATKKQDDGDNDSSEEEEEFEIKQPIEFAAELGKTDIMTRLIKAASEYQSSHTHTTGSYSGDSNQESQIINQDKICELIDKITKLGQQVVSSKNLNILINIFSQNNKSSNNVYYWIYLNLIEETMLILTEAKLLNDTNIVKICNLFHEKKLEVKHLQRLQSITENSTKIHKCGLLTKKIFNEMIKGKQADYSSQSRLNGRGLEALKKKDIQVRWGYCSISVENHMIDQLTNNETLFNIISYAKLCRSKIAGVEANDGSEFAELRSRVQEDYYHKEQPSILDPALFSNVLKVIKTIPLKENATTDNPYTMYSSFTTGKTNYQYKWSKVSKHNIPLPKETVIISVENNTIVGVSCVFEPITASQFNTAIDLLDKIYLKQLQNKSFQGDLLTTLGEFIFHLVKLYPFKRGTGSMVKWVARSILQFHYGKDLDPKLNDLRINDIPYDIYAHLVKTPEEYAKAFKESVEPLLIQRINLNEYYLFQRMFYSSLEKQKQEGNLEAQNVGSTRISVNRNILS
jgi:ankyrin repeat protein